MKRLFVTSFSAEMFAAVKGVCDTPLHIYHLFVGDSFIVDVIKFCFSPQTVGAYRIRPDMGEKG